MEAGKVYDNITHKNNKNKIVNIMQTLNGYRNIVFKNNNDEQKVLSMQGRKLLISYIVNNNVEFKKSANPWKLINDNDPAFFNELDTVATHLGTGVKFLSSDPKVLMNKLQILLAENKAGNNNVFNEISAISDELRRSGVLSLKQLKSLYKNLH